MAKNYHADGNTLDWLNEGERVIASGQAVAVGGVTGVANGDISPGAVGVLHMTGVFILPKAPDEVWGQGALLNLSAEGLLTAKASKIRAGVAWVAADASMPDSPVKLG